MTSTNAQRAGANLFSSSDVFSTNHLLRTNHNRVSIFLSRIYFSPHCRSYYLCLILLCLLCVVWTLVHFGSFPTDTWFLALEGSISALIVVEVAGRAVMQGCAKFCKSWVNVGDFLLGVASIGVLIDVINSITLKGDIGGLASQAWLFLRCLLQYLRLIVFIKNQEKAQVMVRQVINFSELAQPSRASRQDPLPLAEVSKMHLTEEFDEKDGFVGLRVVKPPNPNEETKAVS